MRFVTFDVCEIQNAAGSGGMLLESKRLATHRLHLATTTARVRVVGRVRADGRWNAAAAAVPTTTRAAARKAAAAATSLVGVRLGCENARVCRAVVAAALASDRRIEHSLVVAVVLVVV